MSDADEIRKRIDDARARTSGTVTITSSPAGASVFVDGSSSPAGTTPLAGLRLPRGPHTLTVRLTGKRDVVLNPVVPGGANVALACDFTEPGVTRPAPEPARALPPPQASPSPVGWIVLGAGAAVGLGTFAVDAFVLKPKFDDFDRQRAAGDPAALDTKDSIQTTQTALVIGYGVAAVTMIVGATILLWPKSSKITATPSLGGFALTGSFGPL